MVPKDGGKCGNPFAACENEADIHHAAGFPLQSPTRTWKGGADQPFNVVVLDVSSDDFEDMDTV